MISKQGFIKQLLLVFLCIIVISFFPKNTFAVSLEQELQDVRKELESIRQNKEYLESQINNEKDLQNDYAIELTKLKNQINLLNNDISEKELVVKELELEIELLAEKLDKTESEIEATKEEMAQLEQETNERLVDIYLTQKTFSEIDLFFDPTGSSDIIKLNLYQNSIQDDTNNLVKKFNNKKSDLDKKLFNLDEDRIKVKRDEVQLKEELIALEKSEADLNTKRDIYTQKKQASEQLIASSENQIDILTEEEKEKYKIQQELEQAIFESVSSIPNGTYIEAGTQIGNQGNTGISTGPHLHFAVKYNGGYQNPCNYLSGSPCGGNGNLNWPMKGSFYLSSGYGWRGWSFHYGIDLPNSVSNAPIYAAHSGYVVTGNGGECATYRGPYPCNGPGANYAIVCENRDCNVGYKTFYYHLR